MKTLALCVIAVLVAKEAVANYLQSSEPAPCAAAHQMTAQEPSLPLTPSQEYYIIAEEPAPEFAYIRVPLPPRPAPTHQSVGASLPRTEVVYFQEQPSTSPRTIHYSYPPVPKVYPKSPASLPRPSPTPKHAQTSAPTFIPPSPPREAQVSVPPPSYPTFVQHISSSGPAIGFSPVLPQNSPKTINTYAPPPQSLSNVQYVQIPPSPPAPVPAPACKSNPAPLAPPTSEIIYIHAPPPQRNVQYAPPPMSEPVYAPAPTSYSAPVPSPPLSEIIYIQEPIQTPPKNVRYISSPVPSPGCSESKSIASVPAQAYYSDSYEIIQAPVPSSPVQSISPPESSEFLQFPFTPKKCCCKTF